MPLFEKARVEVYLYTLIYTDTPYGFTKNFETISKYADKLKDATYKALEEEAVLVVVHPVYHSV